MNFEQINMHEVQLFAAGRRFTALLWIESSSRVHVRKICLESGEVFPTHHVPYSSVEEAKNAARGTVEDWANGT